VHEMGFAKIIIDEVNKLAKEKDAKKVTAVKIIMGELLLINPEQLNFWFKALTQGTIIEGAKLDISFVKPKIICTICGKNYNQPIGLCEECGGFVKVEGGKEIVIEKVEMEV